MANTQAFCNQAKVDFMNGVHNLSADTLTAALYLTTATVDAATTAYSSVGEVSGTNYVAGGIAATTASPPALAGTVAHFTPSASIIYANVTLATPFDAVLLYNSTAVGNNAISVHTFGSQTVTAGNFTLTMPVNDGATGLVRIT